MLFINMKFKYDVQEKVSESVRCLKWAVNEMDIRGIILLCYIIYYR